MKINQQIIQEFVKSTKQEPFKESLDLICSYIHSAMEKITHRNQLISSYNILVANEIFTGSEIPKSNIDIFLELNAVNLELNFKQKEQHIFKDKISNFFIEFGKNFKLFSKKEKKLKKEEKKVKKQEQKIIDTENYDVLAFYKDLQIQIAKNAYKTTKIALTHNHIIIYGKDEFVTNINLYPIFIAGDKLTLYNIKNKNETHINFNERFVNIDVMNGLTKGLFKLQLRIFNNMYWNTFKITPNQIFMESLLYNVPSKFYTYNIYETTVGIINYLKNCKLQEFVSICDLDKLMFNEPMNKTPFETAFKFIKSLQVEV